MAKKTSTKYFLSLIVILGNDGLQIMFFQRKSIIYESLSLTIFTLKEKSYDKILKMIKLQHINISFNQKNFE